MDSGIESGSNETSRINLSESLSAERLSNKECRVVNEQDSSSDTNEDIEDTCKNIKNEMVVSQTKEQKQKQNEEIVMESSVSSETASWDPVFVRGSAIDVQCDSASENNYKNSNGQSSHFFIDASSLLDDIEYHSVKTVFAKSPKPRTVHSDGPALEITDLHKEKVRMEPKPVDVKINNFFPCASTSMDVNHYVQTLDNLTRSSSHKEMKGDEVFKPVSSSPESCKNSNSEISDEKLRKTTFRNSEEIEKPTVSKTWEDQTDTTNRQVDDTDEENFVDEDNNDSSNGSGGNDHKPSFIRSNTFELENNEEQTEFVRQSEERRQGSLVFQSSIHQYSGYTGSLSADGILPSTPFNSIIQLQEPLVIHEYSDKPLDSLFYKTEPKAVEVHKSVPHTTKVELTCKKVKRDESTPIVSGGVSTEDFTPVRVGSPLTQRKIESTPIVTGTVPIISPEDKPVVKQNVMPVWVVDMSQTTPNVEKEKSSDSDVPTSSKSSHKSSLGFYVDLNEVSDTEPKPEVAVPEPSESTDKKNIFSMVIDFEAPKKEMPSRLSQSLYLKKTETRTPKPTQNGKEEKKCDKVEEPVLRRPKSTTNMKLHNRHSWNSSGDSDTSTLCHQRTYSIPDSSTESQNKSLHAESPKELKETVSSSSGENKETFTKLENGTSKPECAPEGFVRLSDLDKSATKVVVAEPDQNIARMTRSIPETSWIENKLLLSHSMSCRVSSSKFLPRMSSSTPSSLHFPQIRSKSPGQDTDEMISEFSDLSSMHSSMVLEVSTEETSHSSSYQPQRSADRLGHDLLRMFLDEISPDVTVEVGGRRIKAHKCILSSRCQYFAAMLSGGWVESAGNVISLQGFSYQAVHFAMCHIYSGAADIPESIHLVELATLADMLGLEGLKEIVQYTLKLKHCHLFHKPCNVCVNGVLECLPLAAAYGLDELYRKALRWITRYFVRVWPTKCFAALPRELMEKCYQQHIVHMSADNVLETMLCCDKLLATLPNLRWAEVVHDLVCQLSTACQVYLTQHLASVLACASFLSLGKEMSWNISRLDTGLLQAADKLSPEQACKSYARTHKLLSLLKSGEEIWSPNFIELVEKLLNVVENCVVRQAVRVSHTQFWSRLDLALRNRIQELCCFPLSRPHVSRQPRSTSGSRNLDLRQVRLAMQQHTRRTQSIDARPTTARTVRPVPKPVEPPRPRTWPAHVNPKGKIISSSDSSRTSSPALKRVNKKIGANAKGDMSVDSLTSPVANRAKLIKAKPEAKPVSSLTVVNQADRAKPKPKVGQPAAQKPKPRNSIPQTKPRTMSAGKSGIQGAGKEKGQLSKSLPTVNKENHSADNQSKSGSSSSTQYSPCVPLRKKILPTGQARTNISSYSASPNLRRNLLLAAKAPQVPVKSMSPVTNKKLTRIQVSHSITSPTKSSAAKCVNNAQNPKGAQKQVSKPAKPAEKATVERSGTFLKDEPSVLTKNT